MLKEQVYKPLLGVHSHANIVHEAALITYYTEDPHHLARLEREIEALGRALEGLRLALQAVRSRGEDPLEESYG